MAASTKPEKITEADQPIEQPEAPDKPITNSVAETIAGAATDSAASATASAAASTDVSVGLAPTSPPPEPTMEDAPSAGTKTVQPSSPNLNPTIIKFSDKNQARLLSPPVGTPVGKILAALGLKQPEMTLLVLGAGHALNDKQTSHLVQLFSRGIARAAADSQALVFDNGRHQGITAMMGQGVVDRGRQSTLVGVAPAGCVTYPGSPVAQSSDREALDPNHTHFVLAEGQSWGDETDLLFDLVSALAGDKPVVTVLVEGDDVTKKQMLQAIRHQWPTIIVRGSGGLADEIAKLTRTRPNFVPDPDLAEIVADGHLHFFQIDSPIGAFGQVLDQIAHHEAEYLGTLELAWKTFAMYDENAKRQQKAFTRLQTWTLGLGIFGTLLVLAQKQMELYGYQLTMPFADEILYFVILLVPISVSLLVAAGNRFNAGSKWILSRAGAESIKKEIYRYRSRAEIYSDQQTKKLSRDIKLTRKIEAISTRLMQTEVNTSAISEYEGDLPPQYGANAEDDGFSFLSPDSYLLLRLQDQLQYYRRQTVKLEMRLKRLQWLIYIAGAAGTLLVAIGLELWIALTTSIVTALTTYLEYRKIEERLMRFNQTATELSSVQNWWIALSPEEQAHPDNIDKLIGQTETAIYAEHSAWLQDMQDAMAELRAEQTRDNADQIEPQTTEQKLISLKR